MYEKSMGGSWELGSVVLGVWISKRRLDRIDRADCLDPVMREKV